MKQLILSLLLLVFSTCLKAQDTAFLSIHQLESEHYKVCGISTNENINQPVNKKTDSDTSLLPLQKRVFGYHPYWAGNDYLNYQWDLLSDLCYFSYEVNPATGYPLTTHDWDTDPAIDSALANGTHVHLCVTLFSGHATFFTNSVAQQTLIDQIILLVESRDAHGVNIDVEALPSSYKEEFTDFIIALSTQMDTLLPEAEISIAAPAVNWSNKFNIPVLNQYIDFFMVMGYDYYWPGSSQAGASSPLYPMVGNYTYCFSPTISYYQSQGVPNEKIVMGVPYYAYQWPVQSSTAPSYTTGSGNALTYSNIRNNSSGNYSPENKHREPNSFAAYYAFQTSSWYHCFVEDLYSLSEKYQTINRRNLGGIGIWALGYDNGYSELWDLIGEHFTGDGAIVSGDTIFDSGGPAFDYYDDEQYTYTFRTAENSLMYLKFIQLDLEQGYDTMWVYDGPDINSPLLAIYSGDSLPPLFEASSHVLTFRFYSDGATTDAGWMAIYDTTYISAIGESKSENQVIVKAWPNPVSEGFTLHFSNSLLNGSKMKIISSEGKLMLEQLIITDRQFYIDTEDWPQGLYLVSFFKKGERVGNLKIIKR